MDRVRGGRTDRRWRPQWPDGRPTTTTTSGSAILREFRQLLAAGGRSPDEGDVVLSVNHEKMVTRPAGSVHSSFGRPTRRGHGPRSDALSKGRGGCLQSGVDRPFVFDWPVRRGHGSRSDGPVSVGCGAFSSPSPGKRRSAADVGSGASVAHRLFSDGRSIGARGPDPGRGPPCRGGLLPGPGRPDVPRRLSGLSLGQEESCRGLDQGRLIGFSRTAAASGPRPPPRPRLRARRRATPRPWRARTRSWRPRRGPGRRSPALRRSSAGRGR